MVNDRRRVATSVLLLLAVLTVSVSVACGSSDDSRSVVIGQVTNVVASSVTALSELEIVDEYGATWMFEAHGFVGFTPSHLEEHATTGAPVRVEYFEENGTLIVIEASDG